MAGESAMGSLRGRRVWVAGHRGMVGSAIVRRLERERCHVLTVDRSELDLTRQQPTREWIVRARPDLVIVAAARVGGILANATYPVDFLRDNILIAVNVMTAAHESGVQDLVWLGSSCVYPRDAAQPIREDSLLGGPLEPTNEAYAIAKIAGVVLAASYARQFDRRYMTVMPTNLYGPNDNFDPAQAHVLPALIRKFHEAREDGRPGVTVWGSGKPLREFLHVDDLADACVFLAGRYEGTGPINVGSGEEISIGALAELVADIVGYRGRIDFDPSKPDGTPRKLLDTTRIGDLGWRPKIALRDGVGQLYRHWLDRMARERDPLPVPRLAAR